MEKNLDNQASFWAQYWGQFILVKGQTTMYVNEVTFPKFIAMKDYQLQLKPISLITDEHAMELIKLKFHNDKGNVDEIIRIYDIEKAFDRKGFQLSLSATIEHERWNDFVERIFIGDEKLYSFYADFLRSKGYAVVWNGITVEEQLEYGWIKLVETLEE